MTTSLIAITGVQAASPSKWLRCRFGPFPNLATPTISRKPQPPGERRTRAAELPLWVES